MKRLALLLLLSALLIVPMTSAADSPRTIYIQQSKMSDSGVNTNVGKIIRWVNADNTLHRIVANNKDQAGALLFDSGDIKPGAVWDHSFQAVGTFAYHDYYNGKITGAVKVSPAAPPAPVPAAVPAPTPAPTPSINNLTVSQVQVLFGSKITLSGQINSGSAGQQVQLTYQPYNQPTAILLTTTTTGDNGTFSFVIKPRIQTTYRAAWNGVTSSGVLVTVEPRVSFGHLKKQWVTHVYTATSLAGRKVKVQSKSQFGQWVTIKTLRLGANSAARFKLELPKGTSLLRVAVSINQTTPGYLTGFSRAVLWSQS